MPGNVCVRLRLRAAHVPAIKVAPNQALSPRASQQTNDSDELLAKGDFYEESTVSRWHNHRVRSVSEWTGDYPRGWRVRTTSDGLRDRATRSTLGAALHRVSL